MGNRDKVKYPYCEWMPVRYWAPEVLWWFRNNIPREDYRMRSDHEVLDIITFEFVHEEDALAFKLRFR